jgi:hypothetical protein
MFSKFVAPSAGTAAYPSIASLRVECRPRKEWADAVEKRILDPARERAFQNKRVSKNIDSSIIDF